MQLFALALPLGKMLPGFMVPVFSRDGEFWLQAAASDGRPPVFHKLELDGHNSGPFLHILALRREIPVPIVELDPNPKASESEYIDAFFDGVKIIVGPRLKVGAYLRGALPTMYELLVPRPFALAKLLTYIGEDTVANLVRARKTADIPQVASLFGQDRKKLPAAPSGAIVLDLTEFRKRMSAGKNYYTVDDDELKAN